MRRARYLTLSALALAAAGALWLGRAPSRAGDTPPAVEAQAVGARASSGSMRAEARVRRARYALDYRHQVEVGGRLVDPVWVRGVWTTEPIQEGRVAVEVTDVALGGDEKSMPSPADVAGAFQLALREGGRLDRLAFAPDTELRARGILTTLACTFAYTSGEGDAWSVEEDDRTGRYLASYQRHGDEVIRRRVRFVSARRSGGLDPRRAEQLSAGGATRFRFDAEGLAEVKVDERIKVRPGKDMPDMEVHVTATLRRLESKEVVMRALDLLPLEEIRGHGEAGDSSRQAIERRYLGGARAEDVIARLSEMDALEPHSDAEGAWRTRTFLQARALLRLDPTSAGAIAGALRAHAGGDGRVVSLLAGALAEAGTPQAAAALAGLASSGDLDASARMSVATALGAIEAPTAQTVAALTGTMNDPEVGGVSALALGSSARKLMDADPELAAAAVGDLLERYEKADVSGARATYLEALAASGAMEALPVMRDALGSDDPALARRAVFGLRFIPGTEADELLAGVLGGDGSDVLKEEAIRAIAFRDPAAWRGRLQGALAADPALREAIEKVLARWG